MLRNAGEGSSSFAVAGATGVDAGPKSQRILTLLQVGRLGWEASMHNNVEVALLRVYSVL